MRRGVPVVLGTALILTMVGGVATAVSSQPTSAKACVAANGGLRLPAASGRCASGTTALTLDATGPKGATGARGATGATGPTGPAGPAGTEQRINFTQATPEAATVTHYLGSAGDVGLIVSCQGTVGTQAKLVLDLQGGTHLLSYTATDVGTDSGTPGTVTTRLLHGTAPAVPATTPPPTVPTAIDSLTTAGTSSDVVTVVAASDDGGQATATLDLELNAAAAPACTVNGTLVAS